MPPKGAKRWSPDELKNQFDLAAERKNERHASFIKYADLKEIWNATPQGEKDSRLILLLRRYIVGSSKIPARLEERLRRDYIRVISVLASISWTKWEEFREIFSEEWDEQENNTSPRRTDKALPFVSAALGSRGFLGASGPLFYEAQFFFCPIVIRYEQTNTGCRGARVPVVSSKWIGDGASGNVFEEVVAPGYIEVSDQQDLNTTVSDTLSCQCYNHFVIMQTNKSCLGQSSRSQIHTSQRKLPWRKQKRTTPPIIPYTT